MHVAEEPNTRYILLLFSGCLNLSESDGSDGRKDDVVGPA